MLGEGAPSRAATSTLNDVTRKSNTCKREPAVAVGTETGSRMAQLALVYKRRPFLVFYSLTLAISWSFWIPVAFSYQALIPFWPSTLFLIAGAFGPSLSAIVLTAMDGGRTAVRGLFGGC